jgi:ankyrin repeat protein
MQPPPPPQKQQQQQQPPMQSRLGGNLPDTRLCAVAASGHGVDANARDIDCRTPLFFAAASGRAESAMVAAAGAAPDRRRLKPRRQRATVHFPVLVRLLSQKTWRTSCATVRVIVSANGIMCVPSWQSALCGSPSLQSSVDNGLSAACGRQRVEHGAVIVARRVRLR